MATDSPGKKSPFLRCLATKVHLPRATPQKMRAYVLEATRYGLGFHELEQAFQATFAANTRGFHATKRRFRSRPGAGVPAYVAETQAGGYALGALGVGGEDVGGQAEFGVVAGFDDFFFGAEQGHGHQRAEGFFLVAGHVAVNALHHSKSEERRVGKECRPR